MKKFYKLSPAVSGMVGDKTYGDTIEPTRVETLHFVFLTAPLEDIVESVGFYLVTDEFRDKVLSINPSGVRITKDNLIVETEAVQFDVLYPELKQKALRKYWWLLPFGKPGKNDFGQDRYYQLVVSERVWNLICTLDVATCKAEVWMPA